MSQGQDETKDDLVAALSLIASSDKRPSPRLTSGCNMNIADMLSRYMTLGWQSLTEMFEAHRTHRRKHTKMVIDEDVMKAMVAVRRLLVGKAFECANRHAGDAACLMAGFGSENLTSDYDISIIGRRAPDVADYMFNQFLDMYGSAMPIAFDTNLYTAGIYMNKCICPKLLPQVRRLSSRGLGISTCMLVSDSDTALVIATMKLGLVKLRKSYRTTKRYIQRAEALRQILDARLAKEVRRFRTGPAELRVLRARQKLCTNMSRVVNSILYDGKSETDAVLAFGISSYYAIEAYYCPATVSVVVGEIQAGESSLHIKPREYLCSFIENLGDFTQHLKAAAASRRGTAASHVLHCSKYLYRIAYSAERAGVPIRELSVSRTLSVVRNRGTANYSRLKHAQFTEGMTLTQYLHYIHSITLPMVERGLNMY